MKATFLNPKMRRSNLTPRESYSMSPNSHRSLRSALAIGLLCAVQAALASSALTKMTFNAQSGGQVELRLSLSEPAGEPKVFTTDDPPRIALDFAGVSNALTERNLVVGSGATKSVTAVEAAGRTRVVVDLMRPTSFETRIDGNDVVLTIAGGGDGFVTATNTAVGDPNKNVAVADVTVTAVDFRRGPAGEGRIIFDFTNGGAAIDLKRDKDKLTINMANVRLPEEFAKRLDTLDFATPVKFIDIASNGLGTRAVVTTSGAFEQLAYQSGNQYVLEVAPIKKDAVVAEDAPKPKYDGARVTFNFQDIPVRSALQLIADISQLNIVVADTVQGNATLRLINVPWDQALDLILDSKGLDKRMNGNVIWVAPAKEIADREQQLADARLAMEDRAELLTVYIPVNYGKADVIAKLMTSGSLSGQGGGSTGESNRRGFLSPRGSVSFDQRTNTLLVNDIAPRIEAIRELIRRLDRPVQQVMIESRIVVANDSFRRELGARFGFTGAHEDSQGNVLSTGGRSEALDRLSNNAVNNRYAGRPSGLPVVTPGDIGEAITAPPLGERLNINLPVANPAGSFAFAILGQDYLLDLELSALQQEGKGEVLSNPRVVTASQQEAVIRQGQQIPFVVVQQLQGGAGGTVPQVTFKDAVLELKVTPLISPDQKIFLNLDVSNDSLSGFTPGVNPQPIIDTRRVTTAVLVDSGETVVIGGIYEQSSSYNNTKVPFLGDLPGVGPLFRTTAKRDAKSELLVFVTPKILDDGAEPISDKPTAVMAQ